MKAGFLSDYFEGVGCKRLTKVEFNKQHELNGSKAFESLLGRRERRIQEGNGIPARIFYFRDGEDPFTEEGIYLSWYDTRRKGVYPKAKHQKRNPEFRLFYQRNSVIAKDGMAQPGDLLFIAFETGFSRALVVIAEQGSTFESQLLWLFGFDSKIGDLFQLPNAAPRKSLDFAARRIVESLGLEIPVADDNLLARLLKKFGDRFPSTKKFSEFARTSCSEVEGITDPDTALVRWMESEETAFRVLERHFVESRLKDGFTDVDDFVAYSLSVQNRRKSRAGAGFEHHLCAIFSEHRLKFSWRAVVENKAKPDFLFPGIAKYWDLSFPTAKLTILGAKTSCKDRWRQVLSEGKRVREKHLITLEPAISESQLDEMRDNQLQLVVPAELHATYSQARRQWLWTVKDFIQFVSRRAA